MRRRRMAVQEDLFPLDGPAVSMSTEQRGIRLDRIGALILEVTRNPGPGGDPRRAEEPLRRRVHRIAGDEPHRGATENGRFRPGACPSRTWGAARATAWCSRCAPRLSPLSGRGREAPTPRVHASEPSGESILVTVELAGGRIAARAGRGPRLVIGESVGIRVDPAHTCLFAAASEERLAR